MNISKNVNFQNFAGEYINFDKLHDIFLYDFVDFLGHFDEISLKCLRIEGKMLN